MKTKGIFSEGGVDCSLVVKWYKKDCHREFEDWLHAIWSKVEIVRKYLKFLISMILFFFCKEYYTEYF